MYFFVVQITGSGIITNVITVSKFLMIHFKITNLPANSTVCSQSVYRSLSYMFLSFLILFMAY